MKKDNSIIRVFFPIVTGIISAIGMCRLYGWRSCHSSATRYILCIAVILSVIEAALIITDVRKALLKKRFIIWGIANLIAVSWVTIWAITEKTPHVQYLDAKGEILMMLSVILILFASGVIATSSIIEYRERFLFSLIALIAVFSFSVYNAIEDKITMTGYAHLIEIEQNEQKQEQEKEKEQKKEQKKEQEKTNSRVGNINIVVQKEGSLAEALDNAFGISNQSRYESSQKRATLYSLLSAATGALIMLDGIVIYKKSRCNNENNE